MSIKVNISRKIHSPEALAPILEAERRQGQRIVHCHGVFDLLHIGHIRHFQEAKRRGDVLVVTITPDRFVNKGPHRPVFHENLRSEAIAALDAVDYVAINQWPTAVETITLLKPDFYVKGPDYKNNQKDITGGILKEKQALDAVAGEIVYTEDITFSSSSLINQFLPVFPEAVSRYLERFSSQYSSGDIVEWFSQIQSLKVLVVGEAIIDEYQYCEAIGKSSKEPTLVVKRLSHEKFLGGTLMVASHTANFCGPVDIVTFLGDKDSQSEFIRQKMNPDIQTHFLTRQDAPTIVKRRFIENYFFSKLFEVYEINDSQIGEDDSRRFCETLRRAVPHQDVVIVVDYGHGMLSKEAIDILCSQSKFLALNVQSNAGNLGYHTISTYPRADFICMTEGEARLETRDRRGDLKKMVRAVSEKMNCDRIVVTRGNNGNLAYDTAQGFVETPALTKHVVDRVGAGDAFLSVTSLLAAKGAPMDIIGFVGNAVGAQAVASVGNRSAIERVPLIRYIETLLK